MGKPTGFFEYKRCETDHRSVAERIGDYFEIEIPLSEEILTQQAARCMDCGIPFCHGTGCPLENHIPEFNEFIYQGRWQDACEILHSTNNFPEITGRICPAPCETACTLNINDDAVLIRHIEYQIAERGFSRDWIKPQIAPKKTGKRIAVVGSGPAGLAAAQQLARAGHTVIVFEKDDRIGGLLRYGIPDFKLDKRILDRRLRQLVEEGIQFQTGVHVGEDISPRYLRKMFDAVCLTMGAGVPRDLPVAGRGLTNVHFAMDYLRQQNLINCGGPVNPSQVINAHDKIVVVIGGGDTGSDCVGTARRQGAREIHQFEILPQPPRQRPLDTPWPDWPRILRTSTSQQEGCSRRWCVLTKKITGMNSWGDLLHGCEVEWSRENESWKMKELPGTDFTMKVDLVLLAMGFLHVDHSPLVHKMDMELDQHGNIKIDRNYMTSRPGIFAAGDAHLGASLVVRAIDAGRRAAAAIDQYTHRD